MYDPSVMDREQAAASSIAGLAELYARGERLTWDEAMQEIQARLQAWEVRTGRIGEVMSMAASAHVDSDAWRAWVALQLLVDAGANVDRARVIRARLPLHRVAGLRGPAPFGPG